MKRSSTLVLGILAAFALSTVPACDDKKDDKKAQDTKDGKDTKAKADDTKAEDEKAPETNVEAKAEAPADGGAAGSAADKIGVAECDEYIEKYAKCIGDKVPAPARKQMQEGLDLSVKQWKEAAVGPAKDGLVTACKAALDAAKQSTTSLGCAW